jgi:hypothetical protein
MRAMLEQRHLAFEPRRADSKRQQNDKRSQPKKASKALVRPWSLQQNPRSNALSYAPIDSLMNSFLQSLLLIKLPASGKKSCLFIGRRNQYILEQRIKDPSISQKLKWLLKIKRFARC